MHNVEMCKILVKHGCHSISEGDVWMATCIFKIITLLGGLSLFLFGIGWFLYCPVFIQKAEMIMIEHDNKPFQNPWIVSGPSSKLSAIFLEF